MPEYEVDHGTLHEAATIVRDTKEELRSVDLVNLRGAVEDLLIAWQGEAGSAFQSVAERWKGDCDKLLHAMDVIADLLDKTANTSKAADEAQSDAVNNIAGAMNTIHHV